MTRREAVRLLSLVSAGVWLRRAYASVSYVIAPTAWDAAKAEAAPALAPGAPLSSERLALIEAFRKQSEGLEKKYEARTHKSDWVMPYRLFRPEATGRVPLVVYLHGSGGLGDDNLKQLGLGNVFGTRVWLLSGNQKRFPCYVAVPQTDRGWARYDLSQQSAGPSKVLPGLGEGSRLALEMIDSLCREFPQSIDDRRIYVTGQSMGGAGVWNMMTYRPRFFAAAVPICGSISTEDGAGSLETPLWNFHGDSDKTVPVSVSRDRIAARRKAGGRALYTEYPGVDHNAWEWAFTEPALLQWMFAQRRG